MLGAFFGSGFRLCVHTMHNQTHVCVTVRSMKEKINNQKVARAVTDSIMAEVRERDSARQIQRQTDTETKIETENKDKRPKRRQRH